MRVIITRRAKTVLSIIFILFLFGGSSFLIWRTNQQDSLSPYDSEAAEEDCPNADLVIYVGDQNVCGEDCMSTPEKTEQCPPHRAFQIDVSPQGKYSLKGVVSRGHPGQCQENEEFYLEINGTTSPIIEDDPEPCAISSEVVEDMGEYTFNSGSNTVNMYTNASCPPDDAANSVHLHKLCLYRTPPECGNGIIEFDEQCEPPGSSCTKEGSTGGTCSLECKCNFNPVVEKVIAISDGDPVLGYSSETHTGRVLNNPNTRLEAEFTDADGQEDIKKVYIWWKTQSGSPQLSKEINNDAENASKNSSFGILVTRNASGIWQDIYVPYFVGLTLKWTKAGEIGDNIYINGSNILPMVHLSDIQVKDDTSNSNMVTFGADMRFEFNPSSSVDIVVTGLYNLWGMVDDYVAEDNYTTKWVDSGNDRNLDMFRPTGYIGEISDSYVSEITVPISANDDGALGYVRLDACKNGAESGSNLTRPDGTPYELKDCDDVTDGEGIILEDNNITTGDSLLGTSGGYPDNPLNDDLGLSEELKIGLGDNDEGSLSFYLTLMDMAGNNTYSKDQLSPEIYKLDQWAIVEDALIFGSQGASSSTRNISGGVAEAWGIHAILQRFTPSKIDFTNQALLGKSASLSLLKDLIKTGENKSFKATGHPGILITSPYVELSSQYDMKKETIPNHIEVPVGSNIDTKMSNYCEPEEYCILRGEEALNIKSGFVCDKKGLILINNDINITPSFTSTPSGACIILASGDITVTNPSTSGSGEPYYDKIEGFLIAGGSIEIPGDGGAIPDDDALFVEGGLVGFTVNSEISSVYNTREVIYSLMGNYPVLVVQGNSKYGLLSRILFGSQIDIFQSEVGFKPY